MVLFDLSENGCVTVPNLFLAIYQGFQQLHIPCNAMLPCQFERVNTVTLDLEMPSCEVTSFKHNSNSIPLNILLIRLGENCVDRKDFLLYRNAHAFR